MKKHIKTVALLGATMSFAFSIDGVPRFPAQRSPASPRMLRRALSVSMTFSEEEEEYKRFLNEPVSEHEMRTFLGLLDAPVLTQAILDAAKNTILAELATWNDQQFIALKIKRLFCLRNDVPAVDDEINDFSDLLERLNTQALLLPYDIEKIIKIKKFYTRFLPIELQEIISGWCDR